MNSKSFQDHYDNLNKNGFKISTVHSDGEGSIDIKGHPECPQTPRSGWSQDQWGNYIADLHASPPHTPPSLNLPTLPLLPTLDHQILASAAIHRTDWHFYTNTQSPPLASPTSAIHQGTLFDYRYPTTSLSGTTPVQTGAHPPAGPAPRHPSLPKPGTYHSVASPREAQGTSPVGPPVAWGKSSDSHRGSRRPPRHVPPLRSIPLFTDKHPLCLPRPHP